MKRQSNKKMQILFKRAGRIRLLKFTEGTETAKARLERAPEKTFLECSNSENLEAFLLNFKSKLLVLAELLDFGELPT